MANESSGQSAKPADQTQTRASADTAPTAAPVKMSPTNWADRARTTFDVSPHAIAGALHDLEADAQLTEDEVRSKLDEFSVRKAL